ncbi:sensor histidine kinase [Amycolatopsis sp. lyj-23]|uniref:sensor histidine kinase n=1 Tax=Amycolatopsis sp. lyj-23 TaxID=2789283 RepID=UPI00397B5961
MEAERRDEPGERKRAETQDLFVRLGSHELRTSITVARGYVELIRAAHEDQQTGEDAGIVLDELGKLDRLTGGLTTLMRLDTPLGATELDLDAFLDRLVRRWMPVAERRWSLETGVGIVSANAERLQAAMDSLLENAIAFTRNGDAITVRAWCAPPGFRIEVSDTGRGIAQEDLAHVFEQTWSTRHGDSHGGSGLGLAIVRAAVEARGGKVSVVSSPGAGASFTLSIPDQPRDGSRRGGSSHVPGPAVRQVQRPGNSPRQGVKGTRVQLRPARFLGSMVTRR